MSIDALRDELTNDPLARGYAGMTTAQKIASLNAVDRTLPVAAVSGSEIYNAIDQTEFDALGDPDKAKVDRITSLSDPVNLADLPAGRARATLVAIFTPGAGPISRAALIALTTRPVSRAEELGIGSVDIGFIDNAENP